MNSSVISICIPTYNGEKFLEICLNSAIEQTYRNIEIIIIDDCSTDETYTIAKKYAAKDTRIRVFRNEKNIGLVPNWNKCLELSKGEWIKFLFQDDCLENTCVEKMLDAASPKDKIIASKRKFIFDGNISPSTKNYYQNKVITIQKLGVKQNSPIFIEPGKISLLAAQNICLNFIGEPTVVMFKTDVISEIGTFNQDLTQICDLEYFLRIATTYGIKYIPNALTCFRIHTQSTSSLNISTKSFVTKHSEIVITTHQLLYAPLFNGFRYKLSRLQKYKLKLFFLMHVYEFHKAAIVSSPENLKKFEDVCEKYPIIEKYKNGSLFIKFIFGMIRIKRKLKTNN